MTVNAEKHRRGRLREARIIFAEVIGRMDEPRKSVRSRGPGSSLVKGFASRGSLVRTRANVLRLPVAFREGQGVLPRKKLRFTRSGHSTIETVFYVYVLRSESDSGFYIGFSANLKRRLAQHTRGSSFATKSRGPWKLIYYEAYLNQEDALGRERYLKSGSGRRFLRAQLRHYLRVKGFASRGSDHDTPTLD